MSEQAQPQTEELKKHGDPLDKAVESLGGITRKEQEQAAEQKQQNEKE